MCESAVSSSLHPSDSASQVTPNGTKRRLEEAPNPPVKKSKKGQAPSTVKPSAFTDEAIEQNEHIQKALASIAALA